MHKILITGAGGFVGRNLSEYFSGKYNVLALRHAELDLLDEQKVADFFQKNKIDIVLHCANVGGTRKNNYDADTFDIVEKNLRMFFNLERCLTPDMRMISFGSGAEYSREYYKPKMPENYFDQHVPEDAYGFGKYVMSKFIDNCLNVVNLRIFGIFGKYEDYRFKFISNAIVKNLLHLPIVINQNINFDYLYITDFCKIVEYFINHKPLFTHYNITPSVSIDLVGIAAIINEISDYHSDVVILNEGMNREYSGSNQVLLKEVHGFSFTHYRDSIRELYDYYASILDSLDIETIKQDPYIKNCLAKTHS